MDPPENHPIKNDPHNPDDPENRRADIDDFDEGDDDEGEDEESLDTFSSQPLNPLVAASTGQGQEATAVSSELPHKALKPSPLKVQPQGQLQGTRGDRPLTTSTFTTSSSSGTSSSTPHTASALSGARGEEAVLQGALDRMQRMFLQQMLIMQGTLQQYQVDMDERLEQKLREGKEVRVNDSSSSETPSSNRVPPPPSAGGPPPLSQGAEQSTFQNSDDRVQDRLRDQVAETSHFVNSRSAIDDLQHGDRFTTPNNHSTGQRFERLLPRRPQGPDPLMSQLNPNARSFDLDAASTRDVPYTTSHPENNRNTTLNNSVGSINVSSRQSNYYSLDSGTPSRPTHRFAGQSFMGRPDAEDDADSFAQRTRRAIEARRDTTGDLLGESPLEARARSENLRRLNPVTTLTGMVKGIKTLTKTFTTFSPWKIWWEQMFKSCHLECITMMERRLSPNTREGWQELDQSEQSKRTRRLTYRSLAYEGVPPTCSKIHDTFAELNGVFLGVTDAFPTLMLTLLTYMGSSIDVISMSHISTYDIADHTSLRLMYFKALMVHTDPVSDARTTALNNLLQNTKYATTMAPLEFLEKTIIEAKKVNALFETAQITDGILWTVAVNAIRSATDQEYDSVIDTFRREPGYATQDRNVLYDMFTQMDNKYREKKKSNKSQYAMLAHDNADFEVIRYADGDKRGSGGSRSRRHGGDRPRDGNRKSPSELPCFQMQRDGKCTYNNCKFSHSKSLLASAPPPPPPTENNMAFMVDQLVEVQQAFAAMSARNKSYKSKAKNWKKKYNNSKKSQPSDSKKLKRLTFAPPDSFQKVTGKDKANVAIDDSDDPDASSVTLQEIVTSDESDSEISTTDSSSDHE